MHDLLERLPPLPALDALRAEPAIHVVGGAVRDLLLGRPPREIDLLVEGDAVAVARRVAARAGGDVVVHERFGTATVRTPGGGVDLASARRETYPAPGALPEVELGATVHEDLARRDFTVNAMALRLADGALVTWPGAVEDLDRGLLRVLHDGSFDDDPTRMLRLARYAARLGFAPDEATARLRAAAIAGGALETVTGSRLGAELRLLLREPQPAALGALAEDGLGAALLGEGFSPEPDRIERALALTPPDARADLVALAVTLAAAGGEGDGAGGDLVARLAGLDFPARDREIVAAAASSAPALAAALRERPDAVRLWRALQRATPEAVAVAGALDEGAEAAARRWLDDVRHRRLAITGDDLVAAGRSGVAVGAALRAATEAMLAGEAPTRERQLAVALGTGP